MSIELSDWLRRSGGEEETVERIKGHMPSLEKLVRSKEFQKSTGAGQNGTIKNEGHGYGARPGPNPQDRP